jgi:hypothetical protein
MESSPSAWVDGVADKLFPALKALYPKLSDKPEMHGAAGGSSWGLGAFHVAWFRPDFARKVLTHSGSVVCFGVLKDYPKAIASTAPKPLRIAMTVGDCDIVSSSCTAECTNRHTCMVDGPPCKADWNAANKAFADALGAKGYPYRLLRQIGPHATYPNIADDLRWLWRPTVCPAR